MYIEHKTEIGVHTWLPQQCVRLLIKINLIITEILVQMINHELVKLLCGCDFDYSHRFIIVTLHTQSTVN